MKISLITDGIWPYVIGGMQKHSYLLCKYLAKEKVNIVLLHPETDEYSEEKQKELFTREELAHIEWVSVPRSKKYFFPGHYLCEEWMYSKNCFNLIKNRTDIDFIYTKGLTSWYLLKKKKQLTAKVGIKVHGYEFLQGQANIKEWMNALLLSRPFRYIHRKTDFVFSYGGKITSLIQSMGVIPEKIVEIPGAVEAGWIRKEEKNKKNGSEKKLLFIGRFERRKGIEEINQVLLEIGDNAGFEFHFAGPIPDEKKVNLPHIKYHGLLTSRNQIIELMDQMDVLVCPSYSEGMPNVIMEAMSRGCAVIATDVGAVPLLVDQRNGWLIAPGSSAELKQVIVNVLNCEDHVIEEMGRVSRTRIAAHFTWDIIAGKTQIFLVEHL